jgi:choline dehydrogenase
VSIETFDYVIIGAGSAGCVLANRLSADPGIRVCLIEAGKKDTSLMVRMPAGVGSLIKEANDHNWGFWSEPQAHMNGRKLYWPRGKGWGGSSSINGMVYIRGHAGDYDQWGQMGLKGWSSADVLPYFKRAETYERGANDFHGGDGPLNVSESPMTSPIYKAFVEAGYEKTTEGQSSHESEFLIIYNGKIYEVGSDYSWVQDSRGVYGLGSAGSIALGALACLSGDLVTRAEARKWANKALEIACEYNSDSAPPFHLVIKE